MTKHETTADERHKAAFEDLRVFMIGISERHALSSREVAAIMSRMVGKLCAGSEDMIRIAANNLINGSRE